MKHLYTLLLTLGLLLVLTLTASGAGNGVRIFVNGAPLDAPASYISAGGTTMVPLRAIAEALGCTVAWDPATATVSISSLPEDAAPDGSPLVVLDPGHGGDHNGAEYGGVKEKDLNLAIASKTASLLEAEGVTVRMTRSIDQSVDLYARSGLANTLGADLFVSIHCNASVEHDDALGVYTCAYSQGTEGWQLAQILRETMLDATGAADFGMEERPNLAVLRTAQVPAALVECGFMSTPSELALLTQPEYQDKLARGIADGILACLAQ
ncbi:MAG: N-acetylmuramoyl-L-alanine amidase [Oscillospiraceae bacterium]|nr:N-acetylmuramoyl-L-alanine amidase [Oscillospiraceae bacterium]